MLRRAVQPSSLRTTPYTVWLLVVVVAAALATVFIVGGVDAWLIGGGLVLAVASFGLVVGLRSAWWFLTIVTAGDVIAALFVWPAWPLLLVNAVMLSLLLARPTRRHALRGRPPI